MHVKGVMAPPNAGCPDHPGPSHLDLRCWDFWFGEDGCPLNGTKAGRMDQVLYNVRDPVVPNLRLGTTVPSWPLHNSVEHITVPEKVRLDL